MKYINYLLDILTYMILKYLLESIAMQHDLVDPYLTDEKLAKPRRALILLMKRNPNKFKYLNVPCSSAHTKMES